MSDAPDQHPSEGLEDLAEAILERLRGTPWWDEIHLGHVRQDVLRAVHRGCREAANLAVFRDLWEQAEIELAELMEESAGYLSKHQCEAQCDRFKRLVLLLVKHRGSAQ